MSIPSHWQGFSKITHTCKETESFHGAQKENKWQFPLIKNTRQSFCALKVLITDLKNLEELTWAPHSHTLGARWSLPGGLIPLK